MSTVAAPADDKVVGHAAANGHQKYAGVLVISLGTGG